MREKKPLDYEKLTYLRMEYDDIENLYHMSMRNPSLEVYGLRGEALSVLCLDELSILNPDKYSDEYLERAVTIYDEEQKATHFNILSASVFRRLDTIFDGESGGDLLQRTPSELILEAYHNVLDEKYYAEDGISMVQVTLIEIEKTVDWYESHIYHHDITYAGQELIRRGFNAEDLNYLSAVNLYHAFLEYAAKNAESWAFREDAYLLLKNQYTNGIDSGWLGSVVGDGADACFDRLEQSFNNMIGKTTPSISMDIISGFLQKDPDNKVYKKLAKQYIRRYRPFPSYDRKEFDSLSELGKNAFFEIGGRDPVNELMGMVSLMASEKQYATNK